MSNYTKEDIGSKYACQILKKMSENDYLREITLVAGNDRQK